jgi:hypothetical protein
MIHPAENIPKGKQCDGRTFRCPFLDGSDWCEIDDSLDRLEGLLVREYYASCRSPSCLSAYPHGAVVKIEATP